MNKRKYKINDKFFNKFSKESAYILGYILTDGNISKRIGQVKIASNDKKILELIAKKLKNSYPINSFLRKDRTKIQYVLYLSSKEIYNTLIKIGLTPNKSKTVKMPYIPKKFFFHFLRGVIDGDGSIYIQQDKYKNKTYTFLRVSIISASIKFLSKLQNDISKLSGLKTKNLRKNKTAFDIKYSTKESLELLKLVYKDSKDLRLERKFNKYKNFLTLDK